jgi:hypothetical protein
MQRKVALLSTRLSGTVVALPDTYGLKVKDLVTLLNASKLADIMDDQGKITTKAIPKKSRSLNGLV